MGGWAGADEEDDDEEEEDCDDDDDIEVYKKNRMKYVSTIKL